jgi:hypothetical protein
LIRLGDGHATTILWVLLGTEFVDVVAAERQPQRVAESISNGYPTSTPQRLSAQGSPAHLRRANLP